MPDTINSLTALLMVRPFYKDWSIDGIKILYTDLIYTPDIVIKYVDKSSEDDWDDYDRFTSKKSQVKNKLFQVINFLKKEMLIDKDYNTDERVDSIKKAIKVYLNYIYN